MRNNILKIGIIITLIIILVILTGCGNSKSSSKSSSSKTNKIVKVLNNIADEYVESWEEAGYHVDFTMYKIQNYLDEDGRYIIIASGDTKFKEAPDSTEYIEDVSDYEGKSYGEFRMMYSSADVNYLVVYDSKTDKYYNVEINYETTKLDSAEFEYPVFSNAKEIK